ncbi:hypothetical protein OC842_004192, partial [Tilletia horrida]
MTASRTLCVSSRRLRHTAKAPPALLLPSSVAGLSMRPPPQAICPTARRPSSAVTSDCPQSQDSEALRRPSQRSRSK